jgi:hypothetical protein
MNAGLFLVLNVRFTLRASRLAEPCSGWKRAQSLRRKKGKTHASGWLELVLLGLNKVLKRIVGSGFQRSLLLAIG